MQFKNGNIYLSTDRRRNILEYDNIFYEMDFLNENFKKSKGGNSSVFKLINPNDGTEFAIKFSKYQRNSTFIQENNRFQNEIDALYEAQKQGFKNVIDIMFDGIHSIKGGGSFSYYVMTKADTDLTNFLKTEKIPVSQKLILCYDIIRGINELHSINLYHRDIKPDNIFFVGNTWKIGDLGLSIYRNQRPMLDRKNEKIGPYGWLSPEVMNKVLCEGTLYDKIHDCIIDNFSDIFQLGKLIWFILNGNIPIGQIQFSDFLIKRQDVFNLIIQMLQHKKDRRGKLDDFQSDFELLIS